MEITFLMLTPGTQFPKMQPDSRSRYQAEVPQGWGSWQDLRAGKAQRGQQEKKARHPSHRALGKHHIAEIEMQWGEKLSSENILQYPRNISLQCKWAWPNAVCSLGTALGRGEVSCHWLQLHSSRRRLSWPPQVFFVRVWLSQTDDEVGGMLCPLVSPQQRMLLTDVT